MDRVLRRFLDEVRPRARARHLATYEDVAVSLQSFLETRRRTAARLHLGELRGFLGYWYVRHHQPAPPSHARRFCAATRVLMRWLSAERSPRWRREFLREAGRLSRATARAAQASALLESLALESPGHAEVVEDYCEVVARGRRHLVLRPLSARGLIGPVAVPECLAAAIDPGAILNLVLGKNGGGWRILDYGFCYPPSARGALRADLAAES